VEDRELETFVLQEPDSRIDLELVAIRRRQFVSASYVTLGDVGSDDDHAAAFIRRLLRGMRV
jgi:hypothetical protein